MFPNILIISNIPTHYQIYSCFKFKTQTTLNLRSIWIRLTSSGGNRHCRVVIINWIFDAWEIFCVQLRFVDNGATVTSSVRLLLLLSSTRPTFGTISLWLVGTILLNVSSLVKASLSIVDFSSEVTWILVIESVMLLNMRDFFSHSGSSFDWSLSLSV